MSAVLKMKTCWLLTRVVISAMGTDYTTTTSTASDMLKRPMTKEESSNTDQRCWYVTKTKS